MKQSSARTSLPALLLVAALVVAPGWLCAQPGKTSARPQTPATRGKVQSAAELFKAARLERESGRPDIAIDLCRILMRRYPKDHISTSAAMLMGAEILMGLNRTDDAREWIGKAQKMFPDLAAYQARMAVLNRRNLTRMTERYPRKLNQYWVWSFLFTGYSARGLSHQECRVRWYRFWRELRKLRNHWDRPGVEGGGGRERCAPSGIRRHVELITARLADQALQAARVKAPEMKEVVALLPQRMETLRRIWSSPDPDPVDTRRLSDLMSAIGQKVMQVKYRIKRLHMRRMRGPRRGPGGGGLLTPGRK